MGWSAATAVIAIFSGSEAEDAEDRAYADKQAARGEQENIRATQKAESEAQRAAERRRQLREERIRRGRLIQAGINTGTDESSGLLGAEGGLATQRGAAVGSNLAAGLAADDISQSAQNAADFLGSAQSHMVKVNEWGQTSNMFLNLSVSQAGQPDKPVDNTAQRNWFTAGTQDFENK